MVDQQFQTGVPLGDLPEERQIVRGHQCDRNTGQPGGCSRQALTPAASISRMHSSAEYKVTWRCDGLVGGPADQMWTCASTISMLSPLLATIGGGHATRCRSSSDSLSHILAVPEE